MTDKAISNYAFIDSQNLNLGVRSLGWQVDYRKFRLYLRNKYNVSRAFMFLGKIDGNEPLYSKLRECGFDLIFKPTVHYYENGKRTAKGNVDAELVLYTAAIEYENYNQAVIVSGDGDFACLVDFLIDRNKLLRLLAPNERYSSLLKGYFRYISLVSNLEEKIKRTGISGRSKP